MKRFQKALVVLVISALVFLGLGFSTQSVQAFSMEKLMSYWGYPTFSIGSVVVDKSVTIQTHNLPANDTFDVTMGPMGTKGVNGVKVDVVDSGSGGTKTYTFDIPSSLAGSYQISIRMQSPSSGYYAYNWFYNDTTATVTQPPSATTPPPGYSGYPVFKVLSVVADDTVSIQTSNLPPNDTFKVTMGPMGTKGIGGTLVDEVDSGSGGTKTYTFDIPSTLYGSYKISIRMESPTSGYYAYNWFYNNTTGSATQPPATSTPATPAPTATPTPTQPPGYTGYPTFSILAVARDTSVKMSIEIITRHALTADNRAASGQGTGK